MLGYTETDWHEVINIELKIQAFNLEILCSHEDYRNNFGIQMFYVHRLLPGSLRVDVWYSVSLFFALNEANALAPHESLGEVLKLVGREY